jgi:nitrate reductase NapE component
MDAITLLLKEVITDRQTVTKKSEVKTLVYVVFTLFPATKWYSYSKMVLQLIVVPPCEYPINQFI